MYIQICIKILEWKPNFRNKRGTMWTVYALEDTRRHFPHN